MIWIKLNKAYTSNNKFCENATDGHPWVYFLYHHLEANVLKGDQFPFTFYPYNKIKMKTTDQTKQWTKPFNFGEGKIFKKWLQHYVIDYIVF